MRTVYLSLGSNLGDREGYLREAIARLATPRFTVQRVSPVYETEPVDYLAQPWFLNLVVEGETTLFPLQLLAHTSRIERALGRERSVPKGPRIIDIDILFYGQHMINEPGLIVPHPELHNRRFTLEPLSEIVPDLEHPVLKKSIFQLKSELKDNLIVKKL